MAPVLVVLLLLVVVGPAEAGPFAFARSQSPFFGLCVGCAVGPAVGLCVGCAVGPAVGLCVACSVGPAVGLCVGCAVGPAVGPAGGLVDTSAVDPSSAEATDNAALLQGSITLQRSAPLAAAGKEEKEDMEQIVVADEKEVEQIVEQDELGTQPSPTAQEKLSLRFDDWCLQCMVSANKNKHLLHHRRRRASALVETSQSSKTRQKETCIDPDSADVEAWQCECLNAAIAACEDSTSPDPDTCFTSHICAATEVCASWKEANCQSTSSLLTMEGRSKATSNSSLSNDLDATSQGKCAE